MIIKIDLTIHVIELTSNFDIESRATRVAIDDDAEREKGRLVVAHSIWRRTTFFQFFFKLKL